MDEQTVQSMIDASINKNAVKNQYTNSPIAYHTHNGVDSPLLSNSSDSLVYLRVGVGTHVGAGLTSWISPVGLGTPEADVQYPVPASGVISNLYVHTTNGQPASGSAVFTFRKNGVSQSITITIAAGSAAGNYSDILHSFSVTSGDYVTVQVVNNAAGNSADISYVAYRFTSN